MGLDIVAYSKLKRIAPQEKGRYAKLEEGPAIQLPGLEEPPDLRPGMVAIRSYLLTLTERDFPGRIAGLSEGIYTYEKAMQFRAGSYTSYGQWRDWLARCVGWTDAEACWRAGGPRGPFSELIAFSDCEGLIGPIVASKLAQDFHQMAGDVMRDKDEDYYHQLYLQWQQAFDLAADVGMVRFT